jgi:serine protease Do
MTMMRFNSKRGFLQAGLIFGLAVFADRLGIAQRGAIANNNLGKAKAKAAPFAPASIEDLAKSTLQSVVIITHFGRDGAQDGVGAGFVISPDGLIATSLHVIGEARPVRVRLADGKQHDVTEIYASDRKFDLAIIRIAAEKLPALSMGDSDALKQGASVIALGNPLGLDHSVVQGVVSARRSIEGVEMIQLAIPIEPGNSGGPLLDLRGKVQGILTLKSAMTSNLGFAMPANLLKSLLEKPNPVPMQRWLTIGSLNAKDWTTLFGARWSRKAGHIQVEGAGLGFGGRSLCLARKLAPSPPYEVAVSVKLDHESGAAGLVFAADGGDQHFGFYPSAGQLRLTHFAGPNVFSWNVLRQISSEHYRSGDWNDLRVRVEQEKLFCYVNGQLVAESASPALKGGQIGLAKFRDTRAEFKGFQVSTNPIVPAPGPMLLTESLAHRLQGPDGEPDSDLLEAIQKQGVAGQNALRDRAHRMEEQANRLRRLALAMHCKTVQAELVEALDEPEDRIDLFHAALLVARLDNPDLELSPYRQQLVDMADELAERLPVQSADAVKLSGLIAYLFTENGFHGSRSDFYNRANSYMNSVIDDREGLPITLSILFVELARRIGLERVSGLPLPGYFMVRHVSKSGSDQIIDVFDGGKILTRSEAQAKVIETTGEGFRDSDYRSASKREIILRTLRNLLGIAQRDGLAPEALKYLDVIVALSPDAVGDRLNRARLRLETRDTSGAKQDFKWILDRQPTGLDLEAIAEIYRSL